MIQGDILLKIKGVPLYDIIKDFVPSLQKQGANYTAKCPFHEENTPSFVLSASKQIFKCFGCEGSGKNGIDFLMKMGYDFKDACEYIAQRNNIVLEYEKTKEYEEKELFFKNNDFVYSHNKGNTQVFDYLQKKRGFLSTTIEKYKCFYADSLPNIDLKKSSFLGNMLKRVVIPFFDLNNKILGFGARALDDGIPKYINSNQSVVFSKSDLVFGLNIAKFSIAKNDCVYITEGYFDVMRLYQLGVENVVSASGTAFSNIQLLKIKAYTKNIVFFYDSDAAGIKASIKGIQKALMLGFFVSILPLPKNEDPDSFFRNKTKLDFTSYEESEKLDFFVWQALLTKEEPDISKKEKMLTSIRYNLLCLGGSVDLQNLYHKQVQDILGIPFEIKKEVVLPIKSVPKNYTNVLDIATKQIFSYIVQRPDLFFTNDVFCSFFYEERFCGDKKIPFGDFTIALDNLAKKNVFSKEISNLIEIIYLFCSLAITDYDGKESFVYLMINKLSVFSEKEYCFDELYLCNTIPTNQPQVLAISHVTKSLFNIICTGLSKFEIYNEDLQIIIKKYSNLKI